MLCILRRAQHGGGTPVGDHRGELVWVPPSSAARGAADALLRQRRREILPQLLETDKNVWATHVLWGMQMTECIYVKICLTLSESVLWFESEEEH
jgi:hypothetical protein